MDPTGAPAPGRGLKEFVVGTGGASPYAFTYTPANSELRNSGTFGVIRFTLKQGRLLTGNSSPSPARPSPTLARARVSDQTMQAVILAGGLGTRLRPSVPDLPKAMAEIDGRPFLEYLLEQVRRAGFREAVLCVGYRQDAIREYFRGGEGHNIRLIYSAENEPMGTGGALKLAEPLLTGERWLVMNGDSFLDVPLEAMVRAHDGTGAIVTLAVVRVAEASRFGAVELGPEGEVTAFTEKAARTGPR
jgi:hypothetical protein